MAYPFRILQNEKIPAPAQDVETFIRHALGQHLFKVEKENQDETGRRFKLYIWERNILLDRYSEDNKPAYVYWGGAEIIEWSDSTEIIRMWAATPEDWYLGEFNLDRDKVMEERFGQLEELSSEIRERFIQSVNTDASATQREGSRVEKRGIDDYTLDFLLQFENGKTPKSLFMFVVSAGYLNDPNDPGAIGLMRRVYKALLATRDELNAWKRESGSVPGVVELAESFEQMFPVVGAKNMAEHQILREVARTLFRTYKDPRTAAEQSKYFFDNAELIPHDKREILEQIRTMTIGEASALIAAKPLLEKWKNEYLPNVTQPINTAEGNMKEPEIKVLPRIPKQSKRLNDWKVAWRKVKGRWKGGSNYQELARIANVSPETIADIVKAGDAGLLD